MKYPGRAPDGHVLLRVFVGGALDEAALDGRRRGAGATVARAQLGELLGVDGRAAVQPRRPLPARDAAVPRRPRWRASEAIELALGAAPGPRAWRAAPTAASGIADCVRSGEEAAEGVLR